MGTGAFRRLILSLTILSTLALASGEALGQAGWATSSFQPRLFLGAQVSYDHLLKGSMFFAQDGLATTSDSEVHLTRPGLGWSVSLGLRVSPWIAIELAWDALCHPSAEERVAGYATIDGVLAALRVHFPTGTDLSPFLRLGLGWYFYGDEFEADENGLGTSLGLGLSYQIFHSFEVELLLLYRAWYFRGMALGGDDGDFRCGGGYCPFGDQYVHAVNLAVGFHWNSWIFAW